MTDFAFTPAVVDARVGDTIHWTNSGRASHTATAANGRFDSGRVAGRGTFRFAATTPGTFDYACTFHPEMTGTLRVASGSAPAPPAVFAPSAVAPVVAAPTATDGLTGPDSSTPVTSTIGAPSAAAVEAKDFEFTP